MIVYLIIDKKHHMPVPTADRTGFKYYKSLVSAKIFARRKDAYVLPMDTEKMYQNAESFDGKLDTLIDETTSGTY